MRFFVRRRLRYFALTLAALSALVGFVEWRERALLPTEFVTGWTMLGCITLLALFHVRKKLPLPGIGSAAAWMQLHIYVGLGSSGVFLLHTHGRWPNGTLETTLAGLYGATFLSGLCGLYWTRSIPARLARLSDEILYENVPIIRGKLGDRAQLAALSAVRMAGATTLGQFYQTRLHRYFETRRGWCYRLMPSSKLRKTLLAELTEVRRYLSDAERRQSEELFALVRKRDDLDYHEALQWRLKWWLWAHLTLTYPLLLTAVLHAWLAHAFYGGLP